MSQRDFAAEEIISPTTGNLVPTNAAAGTRNGAAIDRTLVDNPLSVLLSLAAGAATGSPTGQTADLNLQHSVDGSTGWADFTDSSGRGAVTQLTADSTQSQEPVSITDARKFIRIVEVVTLTAGSTPLWPVCSTIILCGHDRQPQQ